MDPIVLVDDITAAPGRRDELHRVFETDYVPVAHERGLVLDDVSLDGNDRLTLRWTLADVATFWNARRGSMTDSRVARFWADAAPMFSARTRRWPQHPFEPAVPDDGEPLPATSHHMVLLADVDEPPKIRLSGGATWFGRHLRGSVGAADASLELALEANSDMRLADVPNAVDIVVLGERCGGAVRAPDIREAIKRTLLLRVEPGTPADVVARFEADLLGMPHHIPAIRNWRLSRVESSRRGWTHCWEQEYEDVSGLRDDYMNHPYHWAYVDGWFDAEDPKCIVAPELMHVFYEVPSSILAVAPGSDA